MVSSRQLLLDLGEALEVEADAGIRQRAARVGRVERGGEGRDQLVEPSKSAGMTSRASSARPSGLVACSRCPGVVKVVTNSITDGANWG